MTKDLAKVLLKEGVGLQEAADLTAREKEGWIVFANNDGREFCPCSSMEKKAPALLRACREAFERAWEDEEEKNAPRQIAPGVDGRFYCLRYGCRTVGRALLLWQTGRERTLSEEECRALAVCALAEGWEALGPMEDGPVRTLLQTEIVTKAELRSRLTPLGLYDLSFYRLLFVFSERGDKEGAMQEVRQALREAGMPAALSVHRGVPVFLTDGQADLRREPGMCEALSRIAGKYGVYLFLSSRFMELSRLRGLFQMAVFLWQGVTEVTPRVVFMDAFQPLGLVFACRQEGWQIMEYCTESLRAIQEHDEANGTPYLRTLQAWLVLGRSAKQAGAALSVHPNTVQYRIHRIEELFELDLGDSNTVHSLMFSFDILLCAGVVSPI